MKLFETVSLLSKQFSKNGLSLVDSPFLILNEKVAGFEGCGRANAAKTVLWTIFSAPGWRRGHPRTYLEFCLFVL